MIKQSPSIKSFIALLIMGLLLSLTVFNGFRFWKLMSEPVQQQAIKTDIPVVSKSKKYPTPQMIISWNLLGKETVKTVQAPKTTLRLTLIGIISSTDEQQAIAIVEDSSRKQNHYKVGDTIKNNVKVKAIQSDHIVIDNNSRDEIVQLKKLKSKSPIIKKVVIQ